jgi:ABC-2 type transport system ATP-binding protein
MSNNAVLRTQKLTKEFDGVRAVNELDLEIARGSIFGLLGPNGSGKTTTIRTCLGVYVPDSGSLTLLGSADPLAVRDRIGYLPEERGLYPKMQVHEQLAFLGTLRGLSQRDANRRAHEWLERLDLSDRAKSATEEFSKGMQQKVQFAAAVIHEPEAVVLDEPFTGLDPVNTRLLKELILEQQARGCTVILSTHRMEQVEAMCEEIALIHRGDLVLRGPVKDIRAQSGSNTLAVEYEGPPGVLDDLPGVVQVHDSGRSARLQLDQDADTQIIVRTLLERAQVHSFSTEQPSIEEIFLEHVGHGAAVISETGELVEEVQA